MFSTPLSAGTPVAPSSPAQIETLTFGMVVTSAPLKDDAGTAETPMKPLRQP
jgi:hypothetical protein